MVTEKVEGMTVKIVGTGNQFIDSRFKPYHAWMKDEEYSKVLDNIAVTCVDVVVICSGEIIIGKRRVEPWPNDWIIGGRMIAGETFEEAAQRNIKRELGLDIDPSRFSYLGTYNFVWAKRYQEPTNHGSHNVSITMTLKISEAEWKKIKFDKKEHRGLKRFKPLMIRNDEKFHPAVRNWANEIIQKNI